MLLQFAMGINVKKGKDMFGGHFTKWKLLPVHEWIQVLYSPTPSGEKQKNRSARGYGLGAHIPVT